MVNFINIVIAATICVANFAFWSAKLKIKVVIILYNIDEERP